MAPPVWMLFVLASYLTADASPVRVRSLRGRLPLLYKPRATGSPVVVETWRHVILCCPTPFLTRDQSRSLSGCQSNARSRNTIWVSAIVFFFFFFKLNVVYNSHHDGSRPSEAMGTMTHTLRWPRACDGIQVQYGYAMSILYKIS